MVDRHGRCVCCRKTEVLIKYEMSYYGVNNTRLTSFYNDIFHIPPCHFAMVIILSGLLNNVHFCGGGSPLSQNFPLLCWWRQNWAFVLVLFVYWRWSARLYKTQRLPLAARENTDCADWVEELYVLGSWNDVIKICLRFVDLLLISKWEPQQSSWENEAKKIL